MWTFRSESHLRKRCMEADSHLLRRRSVTAEAPQIAAAHIAGQRKRVFVASPHAGAHLLARPYAASEHVGALVRQQNNGIFPFGLAEVTLCYQVLEIFEPCIPRDLGPHAIG